MDLLERIQEEMEKADKLVMDLNEMAKKADESFESLVFLSEMAEKIDNVNENLRNVMDIILDVNALDNPSVQDLMDHFEDIGSEAEEAQSALNN